MNDTGTDVKQRPPEGSSQPPASGWDALVALRNQIDRMFDDFGWSDIALPASLREAGARAGWPNLVGRLPAADVVERDDAYEIRVDLPGMRLEDIDLRVSEDKVTIAAERTEERTEDKGEVHLRERSRGALRRSFRLQGGVDVDRAEARFENGVLTLTIPRAAGAREAARKVEIKAG